MSVRVAVLASGGGTTFQALLDHVRASADPTWSVDLLISDRPGAGALDRATTAGVPSLVVSDRGREPSMVVAETLEALGEHDIQAICLAGYLRLVPEEIVGKFGGRMLNVHPALLPSFGGKGMYGDRVHEAVLASGALVSGPTVHLVDAEYDRGKPIAQWPVPVLSGDTTAALRGRVQAAERALYPLVMDHLAQSIIAGSPVPCLSLHGSAYSAAAVGAGEAPADAVMGEILRQAFYIDENRKQHG